MRIGFIGAPGAGKDVLADFFVNNKGFAKFAFADKIKEKFYKRTGLSEEEFKASRGTSLEQQIRKELWAYSAEQTKQDKLYFISPVVRAIEQTDGPIVVTDIRTIAELQTVETLEFQPILILRDYKKELKGEFKPGLGKVIPGTKIPIALVIDFPIFWNDLDDLEETYTNLEQFCQELEEN